MLFNYVSMKKIHPPLMFPKKHQVPSESLSSRIGPSIHRTPVQYQKSLAVSHEFYDNHRTNVEFTLTYLVDRLHAAMVRIARMRFEICLAFH